MSEDKKLTRMLNRLKKQLMAKIDKDDNLQVEKVNRYLNLVQLFYELDAIIKEKGVMIETINATQKFLKSNPAIVEKAKINTQILSIERSFDFKCDEVKDPSGDDLI